MGMITRVYSDDLTLMIVTAVIMYGIARTYKYVLFEPEEDVNANRDR